MENGMAVSWKSTKPSSLRYCREFPGIHALSGTDTVSYPLGKGRPSTLLILDIDIIRLYERLGQPSTIHAQLKTKAESFFVHLYGEKAA